MKEPFARSINPGQEATEAVRETLISWFRENGRDLPWRRTRDPWRVLVSENMLQQIQVKRAIPFYERFVQRFPTVEALAGTPVAEAIRAWGDLGRYRRVVNLHRTARIIVEEHGGKIPSDPEALVRLPGIGPYTAGAVACFAFERDVAFADTNMRRVLHRLFFGVEFPAPAAKDADILALAASLVPPNGGWEWNQALMEFGALLCKARAPLCDVCPLDGRCSARPGMASALADRPRSVKKEASYQYEDSNRYLRGRVLAQLRDDPRGGDEGIALLDLGFRLYDDPTGEHLARLRSAVESLAKDGLAVAFEGGPGAGHPVSGVAEERAEYAADEGDDAAKLRVRLP